MPSLTNKIFKQLNWQQHGIQEAFSFDVPAGHALGTPETLFRKIEKADIEKWKIQFGGGADNNNNTKKADDAFPLDVRGAQVVSVDDHPNDPSLYVVQIDLGTEQRQVVARLKDVYDRNHLQGRNVVVLCNLPPAEIKGVKSEAMILVAETKKKDKTTVTSLLEADNKPTGPWPGTSIAAEGTANAVKVHITLKEFQKLDLKIGKDGKAVFKGKYPLKTQAQQPLGITAQGAEPAAKIK
jgi:methionyl-tRNA synthetase